VVETRREAIISNFEGNHEHYESFTEIVYDLVVQLLHENGFKYHTIERRTKSVESLGTKLKKSPEKYHELSDITDLCGVRIITYFADDVDPIAAAIESEFAIDRARSEDKRKLVDPERFGYVSLHYVAKLSRQRSKLTEYKKFANNIVEIQLRSILQHAWAEIEHDLGYKGPQAIPAEVRHQFSRLAGLLELGDDEFMRIRQGLATYQKDVSAQIKASPSEVLIDALSLLSFIRSSDLVNRLDERIIKEFKLEGEDNEPDSNWVISLLRAGGLRTIDELERNLKDNSRTLLKFGRGFIERDVPTPKGISILLLGYYLAAKNQPLEEINQLFPDKYLQNWVREAKTVIQKMGDLG